MPRTSITVTRETLELFNKKRAEAIGRLGRDINADEFLTYMLKAEKWKK